MNRSTVEEAHLKKYAGAREKQFIGKNTLYPMVNDHWLALRNALKTSKLSKSIIHRFFETISLFPNAVARWSFDDGKRKARQIV